LNGREVGKYILKKREETKKEKKNHGCLGKKKKEDQSSGERGQMADHVKRKRMRKTFKGGVATRAGCRQSIEPPLSTTGKGSKARQTSEKRSPRTAIPPGFARRPKNELELMGWEKIVHGRALNAGRDISGQKGKRGLLAPKRVPQKAEGVAPRP